MQSNISIVTAFFDIGRGDWQGWSKRSNEEYFYYFSNLAQMNVEMVIYTETKFVEQIKNIRNSFGFSDITKVINLENPFNSKTIDKIKKVMSNDYYRSLLIEPECPEYWNPEYVYLNMCKSFFVRNSIDSGYISNDQVAWIDFGYCRSVDRIPQSRIWNYDFGDKINLFQIEQFNDNPIIELMRYNTVYIQGCHLVGPKHAWHDMDSNMWSSFDSMMECGIVDDDQTVLLMAYRKNPEFFKLNFINTNEDGWFVIFKKFNNAK